MKSLISILLFLILKLPAISQQLDGLWKGSMINDSTKKEYPYELMITEKNGKISGYSHTIFQEPDTILFNVKKIRGRISETTIEIEDDGSLDNNFPGRAPKGVKQLNTLILSEEVEMLVISGTWRTTIGPKYGPQKGSLRLQRLNTSPPSALLPRLEQLKLVKAGFAAEYDQKMALARNSLAKTGTPAIPANIQPELPKTPPEPPKTEEPEIIPLSGMPAVIQTEKKPVQKPDIYLKTVKNIPATRIKPENLKALHTRLSTLPEKPAPAPVKIAAPPPVVINPQPTPPQPKPQPAQPQPVAPPAQPQPKPQPVTPIAQPQPKPQPAQPQPQPAPPVSAATEVKKRSNEIQHTLFIQTDSISLSLYDNGEVDGDTVSVLLNGQVVIPRVGLKTTAYQKTIYIPAGMDSVVLLMYAESLGSIPPNTGLIIIKEGEQRYELRFSADTRRNAGVVLRRRRE